MTLELKIVIASLPAGRQGFAKLTVLNLAKIVIAIRQLAEKQSYLNCYLMNKNGYVYIMMNVNNSVLYTGVTSNLLQRVYQHKNGLITGFTQRYHLSKLVYFEIFDFIVDAIAREKQIKSGSRAKKMALIKDANPEFEDLYKTLM